MTIHTVDITNQQHGAAEIALGHLLRPNLLLLFRIDMRHVPFLAGGFFKGCEDLILRDGEGVDIHVFVGCLLGDEHGVLDR